MNPIHHNKTHTLQLVQQVTLAVIFVCAGMVHAQSKYNGIPLEYHKYELAEGVRTKDITYYSDDVACWGMIFYPKNFDPKGKTPAVVVSHGWTGTHTSLLKYGNAFADAGLAALVIDYRGWGKSDGFVTMVDRVITEDDARFTAVSTKVQIKRTRLAPMKQVADIRSAISYIQGEPGIDAERIGLWGSSYAGAHVLTVASMDPRVSVVVSQVTGLAGNGQTEGPMPMTDSELADAIKRARTGQGGQFKTGFSTPRFVDLETARLSKEYRSFHRVKHIPKSVAVLFLLAGNEELINNEKAGKAAYAQIKGPKKLVEYPGVGHFDIYIDGNFFKASGEATNWYRKHFGIE